MLESCAQDIFVFEWMIIDIICMKWCTQMFLQDCLQINRAKVIWYSFHDRLENSIAKMFLNNFDITLYSVKMYEICYLNFC